MADGPTIKIPRGSQEYVAADVTADVTLSMAVEIAIGKDTANLTWYPAGWVGTAGLTRKARTTSTVTFSLVNFPKTQYGVYARLTDSPEVPIIAAGNIAIT